MTSHHDKPKQWRPRFSVRTLIVIIAWTPFFYLVFSAPQFDGVYASLRERGELPSATDWVVRVALLNKALYCFPSLLMFVLLLVADAFVRLCPSRWRLACCSGVVIWGLLAASFLLWILLLPVVGGQSRGI